jgi:hypothetical protein
MLDVWTGALFQLCALLVAAAVLWVCIGHFMCFAQVTDSIGLSLFQSL